MLRFGVPGALWMGLALAPVVIFYFLRMRFRRQPVSSTYIWERIHRAQGGTSKLRWRTILLLLFQVFAVIAAVLAASGPTWLSHRPAGSGTLFLLDISASMTATDCQPNRLTAARSMIEKEIKQMPSGHYGALFTCSSDATLIEAPTDHQYRLVSSLKNVQPSGAAFDEYAVSQRLQEWLSHQDRSWQICLVTDGGLSMNGRSLAALANGKLQVIQIGANAKNIGVVGLRLAEGQGAIATIYNGWPTERNVRLELERENRRQAGLEFRIKPGMNRCIIPWKSLGKPIYGLYQVVLRGNHDDLEIDDRYCLAVNSPRRYRVLLVGEANPFLSAVLDNPQIDLRQARDFPKGSSGSNWDLTIAYRVNVPPNYRGNILAFGVIPRGAPVRPGKGLQGILEGIDSTHPALRFVNWQNTVVNGGKELIPGNGVQTLATVQGRPIISVWEHDGYRIIVCGTDLDASEIGLAGAFPVFLQNILQWCVPQGNNPLAYTMSAGRPVIFSEGPTWRMEETPVGFLDERQGNYLRLLGMSPGIARWRQGSRRGVIAVNVPISEHFIGASEVFRGKSTAIIHGKQLILRYDLISEILLLFLLFLGLEWLIWRGDWHLFRKE